MRTEKEICYLIRQICEAVKYLHDCKIVHLDLKVRWLFFNEIRFLKDTDQFNADYTLEMINILTLATIF